MPADSREVFISYSHDSDPHKKKVLDLANRLRNGGVDCDIDQYHDAPPEGWPNYMKHSIEGARFVLVVCTKKYFKRATDQAPSSEGKGVRWESMLVTQKLYDDGSKNDKFIPVVFSKKDLKYRPPYLTKTTYYWLTDESGYDRLHCRITNQPNVQKPPLGHRMRLPARGGEKETDRTATTRDAKPRTSGRVEMPTQQELHDMRPAQVAGLALAVFQAIERGEKTVRYPHNSWSNMFAFEIIPIWLGKDVVNNVLQHPGGGGSIYGGDSPPAEFKRIMAEAKGLLLRQGWVVRDPDQYSDDFLLLTEEGREAFVTDSWEIDGKWGKNG